jgi:L-threonylcarbamoyladenylate synthase
VLEDLAGRIDMVIDAGATDVGVESTVLNLTVDPPVVLRPGAITLEALAGVLPSVRVAPRQDTDTPLPSPGLLSRHYAPKAPLTVYAGEPGAARRALVAGVREAVKAGIRVGVPATTEDARVLVDLPVVIAGLGEDEDAEGTATRLYAALRELDAAHVDVIFVRDAPHEEGLWRAVRDRLRRAAARVVDVH